MNEFPLFCENNGISHVVVGLTRAETGKVAWPANESGDRDHRMLRCRSSIVA